MAQDEDDPRGGAVSEAKDLIFRERKIRAKTEEQAIRFGDLLECQTSVEIARSALLEARYRLEEAQRAVDDPTVPRIGTPVTSRPAIEGEKATEIVRSAHLMDRAANIARKLYAPAGEISESEKTATTILRRELAKTLESWQKAEEIPGSTHDESFIRAVNEAPADLIEELVRTAITTLAKI